MNNAMRWMAIVSFSLLAACGGDEPVKKVENLEVDVQVNPDGIGYVEIIASADNVKFYKFFFGEIPAEIPVQQNFGSIAHTYETEGTFTITVQAHSSETDFVTYSEDVTIDFFVAIPATGATSPTTRSGMTLIWQDEFNGTEVDESDWTFEIGNGCPNLCGWGNNELEYYRKENTSIVDGNLVIEARSEAFGGNSYTSSRMITKGKFDFKYGRVDIRAALPEGKGVWPALWMLGANIDAVGWPKCGEIDIMEKVGGGIEERKVHGTVHWFADAYANYGGSYTSEISGIFNDKFHVFSITWDAEFIRWYVDDVEYHVIDIRPSHLDEFRENFFFILNVAVGGNWPGSPDATTRFPQRMIVDYIRVFQPQ